jgi:hypothetical protein
MAEEDTDILNITLSSSKDKGPLEMVSGEQRTKWEKIEQVARRLVHNQHLANGDLRILLRDMEDALSLPLND